MEPGHRRLEHTADLMLELWAPGEEALLLEAARAVVEILTEGETPAAGATREVRLDGAVDREDRLVRFVNEVLALAILDGFLVTGGRIALHEGGLVASLTGEPDARDRIRTELKSATYHALELGPRPGGVGARIVIDV